MAFQYSVNIPPEARFYLSHERIYVDKNGNVCGEDCPEVASLLVGAGGQIPWADAIKAGLVPEEDAPVIVEEVEAETPDTPRRGRPPKAKAEGE